VRATCQRLVLVIVAVVGCSSVTSQYRSAAEKDTAEAYRSFLRRHPGSEYEEVARHRLDDLLFLEAREEGSVDALSSYLESSVISYHRQEADSLLARALLLERSEVLRDSLEMHPAADVALELGDILAELGNGTEAAARFLQADSLGADEFGVHLGLARSLSLQGEDTRAIAEFQKALETRPGSSPAYIFLARHHRSRDQQEKALSAYLEAVQKSPENRDLRFELAGMYLEIENPAEAVREFKGIVESDPDRTEALYWLGIAYAAMGDSDLAVLWLRRYLVDARELGDQAAVERTEAKIREITPAGAATHGKVVPGQTYKNQEKKQEQRDTQRGWTTPWGGRQRRRGTGDPWDR
jgi:tetratricopeptide (TPR) repeat protein